MGPTFSRGVQLFPGGGGGGGRPPVPPPSGYALVNIKYTVALFSALDVTIFSAFCMKPNDPLCCKSPYFDLFHPLSPK